MKSIFILIATCFTIISSNIEKANLENTKECTAELSVEKNRNAKYAFEGSINFSLTLKNTSSSATTYSLSTKTLEEACDNISNVESSTINLDFDILLKTNSNENKVTLNGGESFNFIVTVKIPEGTPYDNFSCIEVLAQSEDCEDSGSVTTILSVYVPNPSQG